MSETSDLVRRARGGDAAAFGTLYERYAPYVHAILVAHVERQEAHDLVQDVFLDAWRSVSDLRHEETFTRWLATIARNRARMHWRARKPMVALPENIAATEQDSPSEMDDVLAHLRALPETYREPLALRLVEGLSGAEIAERLGITPGSVRVYLHRGLAMLRARLGDRS